MEELSWVDRTYVFLNNLAMWVDAQRFLHYTRSGNFLPLTNSVGLSSVMEVLAKVWYPITRENLCRRVGWRLVDWAEGEQVQLNAFLRRVPDKKYGGAEELLEEIEKARLA